MRTNLNDIADGIDISLRTLKYHIQQGKKQVNIVNRTLSDINNEYWNYKLYPNGILVVVRKKSADNEINEDIENVKDGNEEYVEADTIEEVDI